MAKFYVSKLSTINNVIESALVHESVNQKITAGKTKDGTWFSKELEAGNEIYTIDKNQHNDWIIASKITYQKNAETITYEGSLPQNLPKRKSFVSYYHNGNQLERKMFETRFGDLIVSKSVNHNDIDSENSDNYIKRLIQNGYLADTTILIVLIGAKTKCRKHVDWEISGALNYRVGDRYAGLLGILLPSHPDFGKPTYYPNNLPKRFAENIESGYAVLKDWDDDRAVMQSYIELAYQNRIYTNKIRNKSILQMQKDTCK
jgi:hypothetical protein